MELQLFMNVSKSLTQRSIGLGNYIRCGGACESVREQNWFARAIRFYFLYSIRYSVELEDIPIRRGHIKNFSRISAVVNNFYLISNNSIIVISLKLSVTWGVKIRIILARTVVIFSSGVRAIKVAFIVALMMSKNVNCVVVAKGATVVSCWLSFIFLRALREGFCWATFCFLMLLLGARFISFCLFSASVFFVRAVCARRGFKFRSISSSISSA